MSTNHSIASVWREEEEGDSAGVSAEESLHTNDHDLTELGTVADDSSHQHQPSHPSITQPISYVEQTDSIYSSISSYYSHPPSSALHPSSLHQSASMTSNQPNPPRQLNPDSANVNANASAPSQFHSSTRVELSDLHSSPSPPFNDPVRMTSFPRDSPSDLTSTSATVPAQAAPVSTYSLPYNRTAAYLLARHRGALTPPHLRASRDEGDSSSLLPIEQHISAANRVMRELDQEKERIQEAMEAQHNQAQTNLHATATTVPETSFSGSFASIAAEAATLNASPQPAALLFPPGVSSLYAETAMRKVPDESNDRPLSVSILATSTSKFPSSVSIPNSNSTSQPWSRALSSPIHTTGLNAEYFRSKLADRMAIGSPESVIQDSFQYQYAQQLADPHLNMSQSSAKLAAAIAAPHAHQTINLSSNPGHSITSVSSPSPSPLAASSPSTSISNLRAQLRQLASSPTFARRQDEPAKLMPQLSPTAADAETASLQTPFDASLSRFAVSGSNGLTLSQLLSSPKEAAPPSVPSSSTAARNAPEAVSAIRQHLDGFSHTLQEFREDLLQQRDQIDQDRAEAMAVLEEGNQTLEESMTLESRNRDVSIESMKKYTETLIEAWNLAHADVWNAEIQRLEDAAAELERKIASFDASQQSWDEERTSQFRQVDDQVVRTLSTLSSSFEAMRAEHETESNHRALLKLRSLETKMHHLVDRHGRDQVQIQAILDAEIQQLMQQRVKL